MAGKIVTIFRNSIASGTIWANIAEHICCTTRATSQCITSLNRQTWISGLPIYVGKAAPGGRRTGRTTIGNTLYGRLSEHRKSIEAVDYLKIEDFAFKVAPMEIDLVSWGEAVLIRHFSPVWNKEISGFGIHDPGSGRAGQKRSVWDRLHLGRTFAAKLPLGNTPLDIDALSVSITQHCQRMIQELGCL